MSFFASYFLYCVHEYMMTQHSYQTELELSMRVTYNTNEIQVRRLCVCVCVCLRMTLWKPGQTLSEVTESQNAWLPLTLVAYPRSGRTFLEVTPSSLSSDALGSCVRSNISVSSTVRWDFFHRASQKYAPPSPKTQLELIWSMVVIY